MKRCKPWVWRVLFFVSLRSCATAGLGFVDIGASASFTASVPGEAAYHPVFSRRPVPGPSCPQLAGRSDPDVRSYIIAVERARLAQRFVFQLRPDDSRTFPATHVAVDLGADDLEERLLSRRETLSE